MPQSNNQSQLTSIRLTLLSVLMPVLLMAMGGLVSWINKLDDRQYNQKDTYATKKELQAAIGTIEKVIDSRFDEREQRDQEARKVFMEWLARIEAQLSDIRKQQDGKQ